jgi:hypothetical protein
LSLALGKLVGDERVGHPTPPLVPLQAIAK